MSFRLVGIDHALSFDLRGSEPLSVGRAVTNDCPVVDPTISRKHAELKLVDGGVEVTDAGSSNGTFVNGVQVDRSVLVAGDQVTFGKVVFRVEALAASGTPLTPIKVVPEPAIAATPPESILAAPVATPVPAPRPGATIVRQIPKSGEFGALGKSASVQSQLAGTADPAEKDRRKLAILLEVSKGLTRATDVDALLAKIAEYAFQTLETDRCAILLMDADGNLQPKIARDRRGTEASTEIPQSIALTAINDKVAVLSDDAGEDERFTGQSVLLQKVRSAMCVPLIGSENRPLGVLYVDNFSLKRFVETDLDFVIAFSGIAAVALENGQFAERIRREALARSNFERFFTPNLAARIASSPDAVKLGGDKRRVAVLFSDIRGFTALSESMNPDDMARLLTEYFTEMVECVFRHGGTLDKFIGDSVMAQWGAPIGEQDDCDRAMHAALDMMAELDGLNARWRDEGRPTLSIGIGLNVGDVFAGNIGSDRRLEYTVIGDPVNVSSRLCGKAEAGEILLSEEFRSALGAPPPLEALPPMELKGKSQPLPVFRVKR
ncbi:MAG TPA: adenylate/guanylate cyclase domain-containing protein [Gemmatimonadaceae bacterium]|nr:adenylate/guanylate cyclase domain-containing protein [Gemmatimonadaceae bacterium]